MADGNLIRRHRRIVHSVTFRLIMWTRTTNQVLEHNESVRQRYYSFDVDCWAPAIGLVLTGHTVCLCSHFSPHYIMTYSLHPSVFRAEEPKQPIYSAFGKKSWPVDDDCPPCSMQWSTGMGWFQ